ncbi:MAG TPA: hypothetical protein VJ728_09505 [Candidatus Binataceae bacterium]|nr:hypothetical protein [Candidatus Binataceae bacterium]
MTGASYIVNSAILLSAIDVFSDLPDALVWIALILMALWLASHTVEF